MSKNYNNQKNANNNSSPKKDFTNELFESTNFVALSGDLNIDKMRRSKNKAKAKQAVEYLQGQGAPIPKIKLDQARSSRNPGKPSDNDARALRDYTRKLSNIFSGVYNSQSNMSDEYGLTSISERRLDSAVGELAQAFYSATRELYDHVAHSQSLFFTPEQKTEAKVFLSEMDELVGASQAGSRAAALRLAFVPIRNLMTRAKFPDIENEMIYDWDTIKDIHQSLILDKPYQKKASTDASSWGHFDDPNDSRGMCDVNATADLIYLPITPYFKELLRAKNVSENVLGALGNYSQVVNTSVDEDEEFSSTDFVEVDIGSRIAHVTGIVDEGELPKWSGPSECTPIQKQLLAFIDQFQLSSKVVFALPKDSTETQGSRRNKLSADLAVKVWTQLTLNAIYKVMLEDGLGILDRANESIKESISHGLGARIPDIAMQVLNSNALYLSKMNEDVISYLSSGTFSYNAEVYNFVKKAWAPKIKRYRDGIKRFIGDNLIDEDQYSLNIIPRLVLHCNPYDSMVEAYESDIDASVNAYDFPDEPESRSVLFTNEVLPTALLDSRTGKNLLTLTVRFDNLLSYALYACKLNARYNGHSYRAKCISGSDKSDYAEMTFKGPHVLEQNGGGTTTRHRSFHGDMYSSCLDRSVKLGLDKGYAYQLVDEVTAQFRTEAADISDADKQPVNIPVSIWYHHTNSWVCRFISTAKWMATNPTFIRRRTHINDHLSKFFDHVLDGRSTPAWMMRSASYLKPNLVANSKYLNDIEIADAFRHSFVVCGSSAMQAIDNKACVSDTRSLVSMTGSSSSSPSQRQVTLYMTKIDSGKKISRQLAMSSFPDFDGSLNPLFGLGLSESAYTGNVLGISSIGGSELISILKSDPVWYRGAKGRLHLFKPSVNTGKYFSTTGLVAFNRDNDIATFTKRIGSISYQAYTNASTPSSYEEGQVKNTFGYCLMDGAMKRWKDAIIAWDKENTQMYTYSISVEEFESIVSRVFAKFKLTPGAQYLKDGDGDMNYVRFSPAMTVVVGTKKTAASCADVNARVYDPVAQSLVSIGHVIYDAKDASYKHTKNMMQSLGQFALDSISSSHFNMIETPIHGMTAKVNEAYIYVDLVKTMYPKSGLPDLISSTQLAYQNVHRE